jgi:hypothetical protein
MSYLLVICGWIIGLLSFVATRTPNSPKSPKKFSFKFWFFDNWLKAMASLILSLVLNFTLSAAVPSMGLDYVEWMALAIGLAPDAALSILKRRIDFLQPNIVEGFNRCHHEDIEE